MSTKTNNFKKSIDNASHNARYLPYGAYGHNRDISETLLPYGTSAALPANSASCELKFH